VSPFKKGWESLFYTLALDDVELSASFFTPQYKLGIKMGGPQSQSGQASEEKSVATQKLNPIHLAFSQPLY
jgi:hypothetical protein